MKKLVVGNWKMNPKTEKEALKLAWEIESGTKNVKNVEVIICPPFIYISNLRSQVSNLTLGAQNCYFKDCGAYTGEISPVMLKDIGCQYVILGHSERRQYFSETDELISKKVKAALSYNLIPILCLGETSTQREKGQTEKVVGGQLKTSLSQISFSDLKTQGLVIAYEPVWAIGTGNICQPQDAKKIAQFIGKIIGDKFGQEIGQNVRILYGGSVNSKNIKGFAQEKEIDGVLVGGASLKAEEFIKIVKIIEKT